MDSSQTRPYFIAALISFLYILVSQLIGSMFFDNNWAYLVWENLSKYYLLVLTIVIYTLLQIFDKKDHLIVSLFEGIKQKIFFVVLFLMFILFQIDSFVFAGGNHYLNEIAQSKLAVIRFYEFFSIAIIKIFFSLFSSFDMHYNTAGVLSFKFFSYLAAVGSLIFSYQIAKNIHSDKNHQIFIFLLIFFGPQSLMYFGFIGVEPIIVTSLLAFFYFVTSYYNKRSLKNLLFLLITCIIALCFHIASLVLLPIFIFVLLSHFVKKKSIVPFIAGIICYILFIVGIYLFGSNNYEFSKYILYTDNNLHHPYDLQSLNHIGDVIMLVLLFFPQLIALKFIFIKQVGRFNESPIVQILLLLSITCNTIIVILEPVHSIVLDAPAFAVFLTPMALLLAFLLKDNLKILKLFAVISIAVLLTYFPVFHSLEKTEGIMKDYLEKNNHFYIESGTAIQDSYFYQKKIDEANYWYTNMDKFSQDFLDIVAATEYISAEMYPDAQRMLLRLKNKFRYWVEPRNLDIEVEINLKRFVSAKKEIDSTLSIEPYNKKTNRLLYNYYRDLGDFVAAENQITKLVGYYPYDYDIRTDQAIINYRLKLIDKADSIAIFVIAHDSTQAFSYLIRGFIAEINKRPQDAIPNFEKFIKYAPNAPETPSIRKRVNELILQQRN